MDKKYLTLNDISAYRLAFDLANYIWEIVIEWDSFVKDTVGKQYTRSVDSISANIAEGFGRFGKKSKVVFYRYSFGSLKEAWDWTEKSRRRNLITNEQYQTITHYLDSLPIEINNLIKFTNDKLSF